MGQQIVGGTRGPSSCLPLLGIACVFVACVVLLLWLNWPRA